MILKANLKTGLFLLLIFFCFTLQAQTQSLTLTGVLVVKETQAPISGVIVNVANVTDQKDVFIAVSGKNGSFSISNLKTRINYQLKASLIGYADLVMNVEGKNKTMNLGTLSMTVKSQAIGEVTVKGEAPTAIQKGDTIEMNASAFKTLENALRSSYNDTSR